MGNIRVLEEGLELQDVEKSKRNQAVIDYFDMKGKAEANGDRFWALDSLYSRHYSFGFIYPDFFYSDWKHLQHTSPLNDLDQRAIQMVQGACGQYRTGKLKDIEEFCAKPEPKTCAGFEIAEWDNYIYDSKSWLKWHDDWLRSNLDQHNWKNGNELFHDYEKCIGILREALQKKKNEDFEPLRTIDVRNLSSHDVVNSFHEFIMKRMNSEDRIAYTKEIGKVICEANYYCYEELLSRLEEKKQKDVNHKDAIREIYSITKDSKRQFISLDTKHGMLEFHNETGKHLGEYRFDGTLNSPSEANHDLIAVQDWEKHI